MLTTDQVNHFHTFGFAVLRGYLADRIGVLRAEADAAIRDAYAATYHERVIDGISGHYLPLAARLTPVSEPGTPLEALPPREQDAAVAVTSADGCAQPADGCCCSARCGR